MNRGAVMVVAALLAGCAAPSRNPLPIDPPKMRLSGGGGGGGSITASSAKAAPKGFELRWTCYPSNTTPDMLFEIRSALTLNSPVTNWPIVATASAHSESADYSTTITNDGMKLRLFTITASNFTGRSSAVSHTSLIPIAEPPPDYWVKRFGGLGVDFGTTVAVAGDGNIVVTGVFSDTVNFGGGPLTSAGGYDVFVAKYSTSGDYIWAKRFGGASSEVAKWLALDSSDNVFICGTLVGGSLMKLDSFGNLDWIRGPTNFSNFSGLSANSEGDVIAVGSFEKIWPGLDFGDGHFADSRNGGTDTFLAKYSRAGSNVWVKAFANAGDSEYGMSVAVGGDDSIFATGYAFASIDLGGGSLNNGTAAYGAFGWLGKFSTDGGHIWSRSCGTINAGGIYSRARRLALSSGDVVLAGEYQNRTELAGQPVDGGAHAILDGTGAYWDMYLAKYAGGNGAFVWAKRMIGALDCSPGGVAVDVVNNIAVSGTFRATVNFGGQSLTTTGLRDEYDIFVAKYADDGSPVWAQKFGGTSGDYAGGDAMTANGNPIVTGEFSGTAAFGTQTLTSAGGFDIFLLKLAP